MAAGFFIDAGTGFPLSITLIRLLSAEEVFRLGDLGAGFNF